MNFSVENYTTFNGSSGSNNSLSNSTQIITVLYQLIYFADIIIGLPSNVGVIWVLLSRKEGILTSDLFVFNVAIMELLNYPAGIYMIFKVISKTKMVLKGVYFLTGFYIIARPLFQSCICVERYLAVVRPVSYLKYRALRYRLPVLISVWVVTVIISLICALRNDVTFSLASLIPIAAVDSFCSHSILRVLRHPPPGEGEKDEMNLMKRRAFITVLIMQITMVINCLPSIILILFMGMLSNKPYYKDFFMISFGILVSGSYVQPLLYLSRVRKLPCTKQS